MARTAYALTSPLALALGCVIDCACQRSAPAPGPALLLLGLVIVVGALHGAAWDLAFAVMARVPPWVRNGFWAVSSLGVSVQLARTLGVFARFSGRYFSLALAAGVACAVAACGACAVLLAMQPTAARPRGLIAEFQTPWRRAAAGVVAVGAVLCFALDLRVFPGLYPSLHTALRLATLFLGMLAIATSLPPKLPSSWPRALWSVVSIVALLTLTWSAHLIVQTHALFRWSWSGAVLQAAQTLTDVDRDGYSSLLAGGDCAPFDANTHPGATEIPDNGVDDNCLRGDRKRTQHAAAERPQEPPSSAAPMDVVLITVDALRADHVGTYDERYGAHGFDTTPHLDELARHARVFQHAYAAGGWTSISLSALMRGVYPRELSLRRVYETNRYRLLLGSQRSRLHAKEHFEKMFPLPRGDSHVTLTSLLRAASVRTIATVNDEYAQILARSSGVAPGFDVYHDIDGVPGDTHDDSTTADTAIAELHAMPDDQRFFLWVHFFGPHTPSRTHPEVRLDGDDVASRYDHEIRFMDKHLGRLLHTIEKREPKTAVFVTADHGEEFLGNERHHGFSLDTSIVHIPLIAHVPGWGKGHIAAPVSLIDLMPTILSLQGAPVPSTLQGRKLSDALAPRHGTPRAVFADTWQYDGRGVRIRAETAAMDGKRRVVFNPLRGTFVLHDPDVQGQPPTDIDPTSPDPLVRSLVTYIESGGAPNLRD